MRTVLIVSPNFPPINAADMQRVRMSLPYFAEFGWRPIVVAVRPQYVEGIQEPLLLDSIPQDVPVRYVRALPQRWTRKAGIGSLALRALPFLYQAGTEMIKNYKTDLTYFSTTMFPAMALGRIWKARLGTPFVLDMQDPWFSEYHDTRPTSQRVPKWWMAHRMHGVMEPWTMKSVDGLIAVSQDYIETLRRRYPWLAERPCETVTFGASESDFNIVRANRQVNRFFRSNDGNLHGVYVGRGGESMARALVIIFKALQIGLREKTNLFSNIRLHFIGTDYASDDRNRKTIEPIARELGIEAYVNEYPHRVPYFEALQLLLDADFLTVPGSDDPQYTASKLFPYILARKPLLAVFHKQSSVVDIVRKTGAGEILSFDSVTQTDRYAEKLYELWSNILESLPYSPKVDWDNFAPYTARETTRRQCALFDRVIAMNEKRLGTHAA